MTVPSVTVSIIIIRKQKHFAYKNSQKIMLCVKILEFFNFQPHSQRSRCGSNLSREKHLQVGTLDLDLEDPG